MMCIIEGICVVCRLWGCVTLWAGSNHKPHHWEVAVVWIATLRRSRPRPHSMVGDPGPISSMPPTAPQRRGR